ncbi:uncharacterized protein in vnfD 5'region-like [Planococcus citri]|uniref:uncharacterized protein in vnfD 5'region-like n=1 Tax=Planococcus citri TaxID=170843 RepID=UPI0031F8659D
MKLCSTIFFALHFPTTAICNSLPAPRPLKKLISGGASITDVFKYNRIYVDKTKFAFTLLTAEEHHVSLLRPRRFGKSLFLDTLKEILEGNTELFKNCYIGKTEYGWKKHIVLTFDFSTFSSKNDGDFDKSLRAALLRMARFNEVSIKGETTNILLIDLLDKLSNKIDHTTTHGIAVLIDEYDTQILRNLDNPTLAQNISKDIDSFFYALKYNSKSSVIKFTFVTGVSNFALFSSASRPNHIADISLEPRYSTALGFTEDEIKKHFSEYIRHMANTRNPAEDQKVTEHTILQEMHNWYNGYFFSKDTNFETRIFNPCSIREYLENGRIQNTWATTGRATSLTYEFQKHSFEEVLKSFYLTPKTVDEVTLKSSSSIDSIKLLPLFYYHGYYSIKEYYPNQTYCLDFPNLEVKQAFENEVDLAVEDRRIEIKNLKSCLEILDLKQFFKTLESIFYHVPSNLNHYNATEKSFHKAIQVLLTCAGIPAKSDYTGLLASPNVVVELKNNVIIFELNMAEKDEKEKVADISLNQRMKKGYENIFFNKQKNVTFVSIFFDAESWDIGWKAEYYLESGEKIQPMTSA